MLFSLASSSFVALSLLPSTLRAARSRSGSVGACFPAIGRNRAGSVSDGGDDMVGVRTLLLFPPFFVFSSSPVPSPSVASGSSGPGCFF